MTDETQTIATTQTDVQGTETETTESGYHVPQAPKKDLSEIPTEDKINHAVKERVEKLKGQYDSKIAELQKKLEGYEQQKQGVSPAQGQQDYQQDGQQQGFVDTGKVQELSQKLIAARVTHEDFDSVINTQLGQMVVNNPFISKAIEFAEEPAEFLYNILKNNKDDIKNILLQANPMLQYNSMIELHSRVKSKPVVKTAPAPIDLDNDEGSSMEGDADLSVDARIRREAQQYNASRVR